MGFNYLSVAKTNKTMQGTKEIWKDVVGYEGLYIISNQGRVYSIKNNKILKQHPCQGYLKCSLRRDKISKTISVHRMLGMAFIPNPDNKPQINHIDGIKNNNTLSNLEWVTVSENGKHAYRIGLAKVKKGISKRLICIETGKQYPCIKDAARELGINYNTLKCMMAPNHRNRNSTTLEYYSKFLQS